MYCKMAFFLLAVAIYSIYRWQHFVRLFSKELLWKLPQVPMMVFITIWNMKKNRPVISYNVYSSTEEGNLTLFNIFKENFPWNILKMSLKCLCYSQKFISGLTELQNHFCKTAVFWLRLPNREPQDKITFVFIYESI